jgi:uncharacterized protein (DUF58 family)
MIPRDVLQKIRRIQIRTAHKVDEMLAGSWHSAFKGRGIEFEEVRPYQVGDDVRTIDWNVTARSDQPFVKLFREERELAVWLLVDLSGSLAFGSQSQTKRELATEVGATLAFSAIKNNDRIGLSMFTDVIEKTVLPNKGSRHVLRLIRELLYLQPMHHGTDLHVAIEHLNRTAKRRSVVFVISDFFAANYERALRIAQRRHDIIPIIINDPRERQLPNVGLIELRDSETGNLVTIDTGAKRNRTDYARRFAEQSEARDAVFRRLKMDPLHLETGADFVEPLRRYFHRRETRH